MLFVNLRTAFPNFFFPLVRAEVGKREVDQSFNYSTVHNENWKYEEFPHLNQAYKLRLPNFLLKMLF